MDPRGHSSKIIKSFDVSKSKSSQSFRPHSSLMDSRGSQLGSSYSDKMTSSKRQGQSESFSISSPNIETTSETQSNNTSILHRVTNTVSGLFSNVSWSEWLKGSSSATSANEHEVSLNDENASESSKLDNQHLNQLYPEEGIAGVNMEMASSSTHHGSDDKPDISMKLNIPSYKDQSFMSSTPSLSPYNKKRRVNEEYLCDSIISKPSTSECHQEVLPPQENCINLLKMSFPESHSETYNGSINTFPSSRKRLRETLEEDETVDGNSYQNASKKRPLQSQLLSEETDAPIESIKRKRPRFSISTYGSPLFSIQKEEEEPSYSIFYPGKIMYGGASNHQRKKNRVIPRKICPRTPVTNSTKADVHSDGGLSHAARRILDCIDKISTPLSDSKRAFQFNTSRDYSLNDSPFVADFHKHRPSSKASSDNHAPPVTKLLTPSKVKITRNFSSLFEAKTADSSVKQKEAKDSIYVNDQWQASSSLNKSSPFMSFTAPVSGNSTQKEMPTPKTYPTSIKSFVNTSSSYTTAELPKQTANSFEERLKSSMSANIFKNFEAKTLIVNKEPEIGYMFKSSDMDTIQYSFSKPGVVSGLMVEEIIPECMMEFKFSQPINEAEIQVQNEKQSFKFSYNKDAGSWECDTCLLQNKSEAEKCVACLSSKPVKTVSQVKPATQVNPFKKDVGSWDCDTCLLRNTSEADKCVACLSSKPAQISTEVKLQTQINLFKKDSGSWECNKCLLYNKNGDEKCVSCSAARSGNSAPMSVNDGFKGSWGDSLKPTKDSWECEMCLLQNKESASNCAACETPKPKSGQKKSINSTFGITTSGSNWSDPFKPIDNSWICETCKMPNTSNASTCVGCKTPKINVSKNEDGNNGKSFNYSFGIPTKENILKDSHEKPKQNQQKDIGSNWLCSECMTTNKISNLKCASCKCSKPSLMNDSVKSKCVPLIAGFGSQFAKGKDEWECETCLVRNKSTAQKCISCATPKIGSNSAIASEVMTGNFKFGANTSQSKSKTPCNFNFGTSSKPTDVNSTSTIKFGSNSETAKEATSSIFKFGSNSETPKEAPSSTLKFGIDSKTEVETSTKISLLPAEKKDSPYLPQNLNEEKDIPSLSSSKFVFGNPSSSITSSTTSVPSNTTSTDSLFSFKPSIPIDNKNKEISVLPSKEEVKPKPVFQFGSTALPNTQKSDTNKLEFPKINSTSTTQSDSFAQLPKVNPSTFSFFGNNAASSPQTTFGASDSNTSNKAFTFDKKEIKPTSASFNFGSGDTNKPSTAGFNFGSGETNKPSTAVFNFGNGDTNKPSTAGFNFGNGDTNKPSTALFNFGNGDTNKPSTAGFNFGTGDTNKPNTAGFNFGNVNSKPKPKAVFNFGSGDSNKPSTSLFQFGGAPPPSSVITFGQQSTTNAFGSPSVQAVEPAVPLHLAIPEQSNPFHMLGSSTSMSNEPPKRVIKKANRRLRQ